MNEFLNDNEKAAVQYFHENEVMREAVKKVLLAAVYSNGTLKPGAPATPLTNSAITFVHTNPGATDEQVGANLRSFYKGVMFIEEGFNYIAQQIKVEPKAKRPNNAR